MINLTYEDIWQRVRRLPTYGKVYGIPNGGLHVVAMLKGCYPDVCPVYFPENADFFVDDIIDSGATSAKFHHEFNRPFYALVDKTNGDKEWKDKWVSFPWERLSKEDPSGIEQNITRILQYIGEDPTREGLLETPARVAKSYEELFAGYKQKPEEVLKTFTDGLIDEMIIVDNIRFTSFCEHHMLPFSGVAHVGYIPCGKIAGLSKIARLVDVFARRLQVQERLTDQIAKSLMEHLQPLGVGCVIEASHSCMSCRGVKKSAARMRTSSLQGVLRDKPEARAEFFSLIRG